LASAVPARQVLFKQKLLRRFFKKRRFLLSAPILALVAREAGDSDPQNEPCP
jgi:hypothetical protein